jgi:hypothetical protein
VTVGEHYSRKEFLDAIFQSYLRERGGFILLKAQQRLDARMSMRYYPNADPLSREQYTQDQHVFFGPAPRDKMKPDREHIRCLTALWAGVDIGPDGHSGKEKHFTNERQAFAALKAFPLPPSIIVGSGVGLHLYWLLRNPIEAEDLPRAEQLLRRISDYFQCTSDSTLDSYLRLPDTWNAKNPAQIFPCEIQYLDAKVRYDLDEFKHLDLRIIIPSKRAPKIPIPVVQPRPRIRIIRESDALSPESAASDGTTMAVPLGDVEIVSVSEEDNGGPATAVPPTAASAPGTGAALSPEAIRDLARCLAGEFSDAMLDKLADRIVDRLVSRMGTITGKDRT